jgi:hypothetical protein
MVLPGVNINLLDGGLNLQPSSNSQVQLYLGCSLSGTPATLTYYGDQQTLKSALVGGELLEAAGYSLNVSGGIVGIMPLEPSVRGGVSTPVKVGAGAGTLALSLAPQAALTITCTTAGALGTAAFTFQVGSVVSAPVVSAAGWSSTGYRVPGTFTTVVFTAGSYVAGGTPDIYTISTLGVVAHPQGAGPAVPTFTSSPVDSYYGAKVVITLGGANGTMRFTYSLDGTDGSMSAEIVSSGGGTYAVPNTGIVFTFTGTQTAGDLWTFNSAGPTYSTTDRAAALTALQTTYLSSALYSMATFIGSVASSAAFATEVAALETSAGTLFNNGVYVRFFQGGPTVGSILPNAGSVTVDSADTDSVVIAARQGMSADNVVPCAGDWSMTSPVTGLVFRRNAVWAAAARAADVEASQNLGAVASGGVSSAVALYRDENATPGFDAAGLTCLRTLGGGSTVVYITDAHTATLSTSDYYPLTNARVVDRACVIVRAKALPLINAKIPTTTRNGLPGVITETKAQQIEGDIGGALRSALVDGSPQDAVSTRVVVNRTNNVLATSTLILAVSVQPYAYARTITANIGMTVNAG